MSATRTILALALTSAALATPRAAAAFCRTSVCMKETSQVCVPAGPADCGTALFWSSHCLGFWMQKDASSQVSLALATSVVSNAFANWMSVDCGGGMHPNILVKSGGDVACHAQEYNQQEGNANIIMFDDSSWPYEGSPNTLALTTVTYDLDTGEIYDADMELNSHDVTFTTSDTNVQFDLASIVQHESGHFLGLAHSADPEATMFATYKQGDIGLRTLDPDDIAAICATYPPAAAIDPSCDDTPRHGFSSECGAEQMMTSTACCSVARGAPSDGGPALGAFAAAVALALSRSRSRSKRARGTRP
jgi:Matrixin